MSGFDLPIQTVIRRKFLYVSMSNCSCFIRSPMHRGSMILTNDRNCRLRKYILQERNGSPFNLPVNTPPAKAGCFGLRLKAGLTGPSARSSPLPLRVRAWERGSCKQLIFLIHIPSSWPSRQWLHTSPKAPAFGALPPASMPSFRVRRHALSTARINRARQPLRTS